MEAGSLLFSDFPQASSAGRALHLGVCTHCNVRGAPIDASHKRRPGAQSICSHHDHLPPPETHCSKVVPALLASLRWNVATQRRWACDFVYFAILDVCCAQNLLVGDAGRRRAGRDLRDARPLSDLGSESAPKLGFAKAFSISGQTPAAQGRRLKSFLRPQYRYGSISSSGIALNTCGMFVGVAWCRQDLSSSPKFRDPSSST